MAPLVQVTRTAALRYFSRWKLTDSSLVDTDMTVDELTALSKPGAGEPTRPAKVPSDAVWLFSTSSPIWNTGDGTLAPGNFEQAPEGVWAGVGDPDPVLFAGKTAIALSTDQTITAKGASYRIQAGALVKL